MMYRKGRLASLSLLVVAAVLIHGCGFHLRGSVELPEAMARTYIQGSTWDPMVIELRYALRSAGVTVAEEAADSTAVFRLLGHDFNRRTLSVDGDGKVVEYELHLRVRFDVTDPQSQALVPEQTIDLVRGYLNPDTQVLGKQQEQDTLRREMQRDMAQRILDRLYAQLS